MTIRLRHGGVIRGNLNSGANAALPPDWSVEALEQKIQASDKQADDWFGNAVAISGDSLTAIVGAYFEDTGGSKAGAAYIFARSGDTWTEIQKIQASDAEADDDFGKSVAISGDGQTAIVGAYLEGTGGYRAGSAYIFTRSGDTWTEIQKIQASDRQASDSFGQSVAISSDGQTAIVGAWGEDTGGSAAGAAYIFARSGDTWSQQQKIQASDKEADDFFGVSVAISSDGQTAIVGAYWEDTGASYAGAAYIFSRSGSTWTEMQKIQASDKQSNDLFGWSVAISGDGQTAIVGAYSEDTGGSDAGSAYIFTRSGDTWTEIQKIQASDKEASDRFGHSVSISGDGQTAIVGAVWDDTSDSDTGAAYIFTRSGDTWTEVKKIQASDKQSFDRLGESVAISEDSQTTIVGAYLEDTGGSDAGAAYIYMI